MLITKTDPVGIDALIQKFQTKLHTDLYARWSIADYEGDGEPRYHCYGRAYRNAAVSDSGFIAEVFTGTDYKEVFWDDRLYAISFFGIGSEITKAVGNSADVHLVFFVNTKKLKPNVAHRADEEIRFDVQEIIGKNSFGFNLNSIELWVENVLREYPGSLRDNRLKFVDMSPCHCFRINMTLNYKPQYCTSLNFN